MKRKTTGKLHRLLEQLSYPITTAPEAPNRLTKSFSHSTAVQQQRFDYGEPIQLQLPHSIQFSETKSAVYDSTDTVSSFGTTTRATFEERPPARQETSKPSFTEKEEIIEQEKTAPTKPEKPAKPEAQYVPFTEEVDDDETLFENDLEDLINNHKEDKKTSPSKAASTAQRQESEEELSIFDKMEKAQSMTYDLGTVQLSSSFKDFDDQLDIEELEKGERSQKASKAQEAIFQEVDVIEDIDQEAMEELNDSAEPKPQHTMAQSLPNTGGTLFNLRGKKLGLTEEQGSEAIIIINQALIRDIRTQKREAKKNKQAPPRFRLSAFNADDYLVLPPLTHRRTIEQIMTNDDTKSHQEYGGRGLLPINPDTGQVLFDQFQHVRSADGQPAGPNDNAATIRLGIMHADEQNRFNHDFFAKDYTWHSHPGGSWKKENEQDPWLSAEEFDRRKLLSEPIGATTIGGNSVIVKSYDLGPSIRDIQNAHNSYNRSIDEEENRGLQIHPHRDNFVIHKKQKRVFYYNHRTPENAGASQASFHLNKFYTLDGTQNN